MGRHPRSRALASQAAGLAARARSKAPPISGATKPAAGRAASPSQGEDWRLIRARAVADRPHRRQALRKGPWSTQCGSQTGPWGGAMGGGIPTKATTPVGRAAFQAAMAARLIWIWSLVLRQGEPSIRKYSVTGHLARDALARRAEDTARRQRRQAQPLGTRKSSWTRVSRRACAARGQLGHRALAKVPTLATPCTADAQAVHVKSQPASTLSRRRGPGATSSACTKGMPLGWRRPSVSGRGPRGGAFLGRKSLRLGRRRLRTAASGA
jgi:hypothetical protein